MSLTTRDVAAALQRQHRREQHLEATLVRLADAAQDALEGRETTDALPSLIRYARRMAEDREASNG